MDVFDAVKTRRSIRKFENRNVEREKILKILEAARLSPSAANNQPWRFIVVSEKAVRERLFTAYPREWFGKAPVIVAVCVTPEAAWSRQDGEVYWKVDAAIAGQDMVLVAHELGLGSCWIAAFDEAKAKSALGVPENARVVVLLALGYPAEAKGAVTERKAFEEVVSFEHW